MIKYPSRDRLTRPETKDDGMQWSMEKEIAAILLILIWKAAPCQFLNSKTLDPSMLGGDMPSLQIDRLKVYISGKRHFILPFNPVHAATQCSR